MIDATLQELWAIKDSIAKEQGYDLDNLLDYLNQKYHPNQAAQDSVQSGPAPALTFFEPNGLQAFRSEMQTHTGESLEPAK